MYKEKQKTINTIQKTLLTAALQEGFWDRWVAHGIDIEVIKKYRTKLMALDGWIEVFGKQADDYTKLAEKSEINNDLIQAELYYRRASLYFNLIQWLYPEPSDTKLYWYEQCLHAVYKADNVSSDKIERLSIQINDKLYVGRVRQSQHNALGIVIIVNPIDSSKEELYTYEDDFANANFTVVSFDGPGQGETLLKNKHKADKVSWDCFLEGIINHVDTHFTGLPIYLFGTSSGGAWAIEAAKHRLISKTIAVSPAHKSNIRMPDYFIERMSNILNEIEEEFLPELKELNNINNILVFHGGKDVMVEEHVLINLFNQFSPEKRFIIYKDETHCCNYRLPELRQRSIKWLKGENINAI